MSALTSDVILQRMMSLHPKVMDLTLDRVWRLLDRIGSPEKSLPPVIHIAGTNGKGSTLAMIRAGIEAAGLSAHAYTSPHLERFHERIRISGKIISEDMLSTILDECYIANGPDQITYFEITTCAALLAMARADADYTLLEVGLGGRLDATNVVERPKLCVITPISIDHEHFLGNTLGKIAFEKAGIIKKDVPVVVGPQPQEAMDVIEEVAEKEPEKIITVNVPGDKSIDQPSLDRLVQGLQITSDQSADFCDQIQKIYTSFLSTDASLVEVNPFVLTGDGNFLALDAKVSIDDNALYKHKDIAEMRDETEEDPAEIEASKHELNYVKLDGSIGCMVNGAGLAMGTMDIIQLHGGSPANFLDVGGGATKERVAKAFSIILQDPNVKVILVNIFGGIMKCDIIAEGVVAAAKELSIQVPLVVRLEGTNVELGKEILNKSGLAIISADNLEDAAQKAVGALS